MLFFVLHKIRTSVSIQTVGFQQWHNNLADLYWIKTASRNNCLVRFHNAVLMRRFPSPTHHMPKSHKWADVWLFWICKATLLLLFTAIFIYSLLPRHHKYMQPAIFLEQVFCSSPLGRRFSAGYFISAGDFCWDEVAGCDADSRREVCILLLLFLFIKMCNSGTS